jgi:hypothetical protein
MRKRQKAAQEAYEAQWANGKVLSRQQGTCTGGGWLRATVTRVFGKLILPMHAQLPHQRS